MISFMPIVGEITPPGQLDGYGSDVTGGGTAGMGLIGLVSNVIKIVIVVGGLWAFINLILAGITFITSGDKPDELSKANNRMTMSLLGLIIMVGSYSLAGIIGKVLFGEWNAILNPVIYGPGS